MIVISLINGSMISETSSLYALKYAKQLNLKLYLVHIKSNDSLEDVKKSVGNIETLISKYDVEYEFIILDTLKELKKIVQKRDVDMLFCSTRHKHSFFDKSFVKTIIKQNMKVDLSVVKIVKIGLAQSVDRVILPIREAKLSVKKFALFSTFIAMFDAKAEIYSIDKTSNKRLFDIDVYKQKNRLKDVVFNLRHYLKLMKLQNMKFSIKHDYAKKESDIVQTHVAGGKYDLAIVGAHIDKSYFSSHPIDILFQKPMINIIYFIPAE